MDQMIIPGAYVIRASQTSTVLQTRDKAFSSWSWVDISAQDENKYRDQQIWWIEPFPFHKYGGGKLEVTWSITNTFNEKALGLREGNGSKGTGRVLWLYWG